MHRHPEMPGLSRHIFGAAAMIACGRGATTPDVPATMQPGTPERQRALVDFLGTRRDSIACSDIPADVPVDGLDGPQRASRYLLGLTAAAWTLGGPSWPGIDRLVGVLFASSIALAYLLGRLAMGRIAAAAVAGCYMLSPAHLANVVDLRDYSKAPFYAATLVIAGLLVLRPRRGRVVLAWSAAAGAMVGIGFGMRTDIALNLIVVLGTVLVFLPGGAGRWKLRAAAAAVCVAAFLAAAAPILRSGASGSTLWHWALLGYAQESDDALDIEPAAYELGHFYSDSYVATIVDAYWGRTTGSAAQVSTGLPQHATASRRYYSSLLETFPADALLRGWAAVIRVLELPYSGLQSMAEGTLPAIVSRTSAFATRLLSWGEGLGLPLFAAVVLCVSVRNMRIAVWMSALVAFLGAYPAIQFKARHVFHLELLSLWVLGFAASSIGGLLARRAAPTRPGAPPFSGTLSLRQPVWVCWGGGALRGFAPAGGRGGPPPGATAP